MSKIKSYCWRKCKSEMRPESGFQIALNRPEIKKMKMMSQFFEIKSSSNFFDVVEFLLSSLVTGASFMPISLLIRCL